MPGSDILPGITPLNRFLPTSFRHTLLLEHRSQWLTVSSHKLSGPITHLTVSAKRYQHPSMTMHNISNEEGITEQPARASLLAQ